MIRSKILGTGSYLPEQKLTNYDLEKLVDTNHEWIVERTGIHSRRIAAEGQNTTDLAYEAAVEALRNANLDAKDIDLILFATVSPDTFMPTAACILQQKLGAGNCAALDVSAACSGFIYGLTVADQFIRTGDMKNILVIGAEIISRFVDYEDRGTCILFGDGAGAVVLGQCPEGEESQILSHDLNADGSLSELLTIPAGASAMPFNQKVLDEKQHYIKMNGREIFKNAVRAMASSSKKSLEKAQVPPEKVDWVIPHQANLRIIETVAKYFGVSMEKVIVEIEEMGNTSSATIPYSFNESIKKGKIKRGDTILFTAFGGGLTSGSILLRY